MELHFEVAGEGEPLVILHGLFGSLENWRPMSKRLAQHFKVFALDQRNHGQSPHSFEMDYLLMAKDVRDFLGAQALTDCFVLGHSMGGKTAMQLALSYPGSVRKLVVADMSPRADSGRHETIIAGMRSLDLPRYQTRKEMSPLWPRQCRIFRLDSSCSRTWRENRSAGSRGRSGWNKSIKITRT